MRGIIEQAVVPQDASVVDQDCHPLDSDRKTRMVREIEVNRHRADFLCGGLPCIQIARADHNVEASVNEPSCDGLANPPIAACDQSLMHRYLTFSVASPIMARISEMIQKRMTICGSAHPFFS